MILTFDEAVYRNLLATVAPQVIETEAEYDRLLAVTEQLTFSNHRTPEEQALYKLLVKLIEVYEAENYPMEQSAPHEILSHIMEVSGTCEADLVGIIGSSNAVSEVVKGKRSLSNAQARLLGDYFKISPSLFI